MLKHILMASLLVAGAARAEDTRPVQLRIKSCDMPSTVNPIHVKVGFTVTETGALTDLHVMDSSGSTDIDEKVVKCVAQFTYKPATKDGVPVAAHDSYTYNQADIRDMKGEHRIFAEYERDADKRCHKLYPVDRNFLGSQTVSIIIVSRKDGGEVETKVMQSAGEKADHNAELCLKKLIADHEELPATFSRGFSVDWVRHRR